MHSPKAPFRLSTPWDGTSTWRHRPTLASSQLSIPKAPPPNLLNARSRFLIVARVSTQLASQRLLSPQQSPRTLRLNFPFSNCLSTHKLWMRPRHWKLPRLLPPFPSRRILLTAHVPTASASSCPNRKTIVSCAQQPLFLNVELPIWYCSAMRRQSTRALRSLAWMSRQLPSFPLTTPHTRSATRRNSHACAPRRA